MGKIRIGPAEYPIKSLKEDAGIPVFAMPDLANPEPVRVKEIEVVERNIEIPVYIEKRIEVPVEVIREITKEVIKEVIIEKPVEVIREIIVEKPVEIIKEIEKSVFVPKVEFIDRIKTNTVNKKFIPLWIKIALVVETLAIIILATN